MHPVSRLVDSIRSSTDARIRDCRLPSSISGPHQCVSLRNPRPDGSIRGKLGLESSQSGPCRDRTDDIHGVNVALYQLS